MFSNNTQIITHAQAGQSVQPQDCGRVSVPATTEYPPSALEVFGACLDSKWRYILFELYKLSKLGHCTIQDIDIRFHVQRWVEYEYFTRGRPATAKDINVLLEELGLVTIDEEAFDALEASDRDTADALYNQKFDEAVDYIEKGICQKWKMLCEEIDCSREDLPARTKREYRDSFVFPKGVVLPCQYSSAMRDMLYDCFCYMYEEIKIIPYAYNPEFDNYRLEWAISTWLERMYFSFGDVRSNLVTLHLMKMVFGIDTYEPLFKVRSVHFSKSWCPTTMFSMSPYTTELTCYMRLCLMDLWDEFEDEYFKADFHKIHLGDFAPVEV